MMRLCDFYCLEENIPLGVQVSTGSGYSNCQNHCVKDASFRQCSPGFQISIWSTDLLKHWQSFESIGKSWTQRAVKEERKESKLLSKGFKGFGTLHWVFVMLCSGLPWRSPVHARWVLTTEMHLWPFCYSSRHNRAIHNHQCKKEELLRNVAWGVRCHRVAHGWRGRRLSPFSSTGADSKHTLTVCEEFTCYTVEILPVYLIWFWCLR